LHVAAVSLLVGVAAALDKHVASVEPDVHATAVPHLHVESVQIFVKGVPHSAADPHKQVPASQVFELPVQVIKLHGAKIDSRSNKCYIRP
jgi:hypothetical protein